MDEANSRVLESEDLGRFREEHCTDRIVFTNGCFDLLHRGHVWLLGRAREFGSCLIVGINSDDSLRRLKGASRPLMHQDDRAFILLQLRSVDYVTVFDEDTPLETIRKLKPDVLVKGAEYEKDEIVGGDYVEALGGRVERIEMLESYSTSDLIERIKREA
ncbi:MAG: D-glycero-beta-D-manno-heptose 1-phosphate adenylyltransferase [bacterium]|nr:MAG: D-glycero-beta-D-manno-heptose 1-phosphate adenylyltransferase [bacterium]